ncbi:MAG: peptide chain release factor 2 [Acidimicrobiales bacterium]|jgi:peptide chain release factor 2|nr:peptide chain release factor 2 [Acidimicrobiales bacterium]MDP6297984.1 peptide chain release factor 2 [Acidimicrobiales bacterium]HJM28348.1 peptide chain release factor 2 [Acidimicrobiales bacterium]HJM96988.1 peptide chain release factor 2 [Acidimicrobiales bacterium]
MSELTLDPLKLRKRLDEASLYLRIEEIVDRRTELEDLVAQPNFWDDIELAKKLSRELAEITEDIQLFHGLAANIDDAETLLELSQEEGDQATIEEAGILLTEADKAFDDLELRSLFTGEHDESDAVCYIQSGEGGTEAQDWAEMLLRMYQRWADQRGFSFELTSVSEGTEAGISSAEFIVSGRRAYGMLQSEHGVHRLVRISPFNKQANRHTSFASMHVVPFFEEVSDEIDIDETELRIDTFRSSGAGGQHVNVTDSAVRITHIPSGVVVSCQNERSQHQNKDRCMQMLSARLLDLERKQREEEIASISGENKNVGFGSQIRSYVMQPYQMVKDVRSNHEIGAVESVLNGEIDPFIEAYLRWSRSESTNT